MPEYRCRITSKDGRITSRVIYSDSMSALKQQVVKEGGFLVDAEKISGFPYLSLSLGKRKPGAREFYSFNQEFLTLMRAGLPVVSALDSIVEKQGESHFSKFLQQIRNDISQGESISRAFERHEYFFSPLYTAILRSGEAGGNIPDVLEEYLEYFERSREIRQKIRAASVYPAILTVCSVAVVVFLIVYVLPSITGSFFKADAELPLLTRILLTVSDTIRTRFRAIFLVVIAVASVVYWYTRTDRGKLLVDRLFLKLPFFGELIVIYSTSLFTSSLSTVLGGGIPLNRALPISVGVIRNTFMAGRLEQAVHSIEQGEKVARAFENTQVVPHMALTMIAAGEEGGTLEKVLKEVARFYEKEVALKLTIVTTAIEPLLMVFMGIVIGLIILAMYMPIFEMAGTIV